MAAPHYHPVDPSIACTNDDEEEGLEYAIFRGLGPPDPLYACAVDPPRPRRLPLRSRTVSLDLYPIAAFVVVLFVILVGLYWHDGYHHDE